MWPLSMPPLILLPFLPILIPCLPRVPVHRGLVGRHRLRLGAMPGAIAPMSMAIWARCVHLLVQSVACATVPWIRIVHVRHSVVNLLQKEVIFGMMVAEYLVYLFECLRTQRPNPNAMQIPATSGFGAIPARFSPQCQSRRRNRGRSQTQ
jgi:hypothetical protein